MSTPNDAPQEHQTFTARATLVAIGIKVRQIGLLKPIFQKVRIAQKTVKFSPAEKLVDALITILAGAQGWWRPISGSAQIRDSSRPLAAQVVPNNRSSRTPWMPALQRT
jgi:hypothetical protein